MRSVNYDQFFFHNKPLTVLQIAVKLSNRELNVLTYKSIPKF